MTKVGVGNIPLHERLVFGYDGTDYRVVKVDTAGNLLVALNTDQNVQSRGYGWISNAWQKNPLSFGYSGQVSERLLDDNLPAGFKQVLGAKCPPERIWVVTIATVKYTGTVPDYILLRVIGMDSTPFLVYQTSPTSNQPYLFSGQVVLQENDQMAAEVFNATATDDLQADWAGYYVDIDQ